MRIQRFFKNVRMRAKWLLAYSAIFILVLILGDVIMYIVVRHAIEAQSVLTVAHREMIHMPVAVALEKIRFVIIGTGGLSVALVTLLLMWSSGYVARPFKQLMDRLEKGATGDLSVRMIEDSNDEIGQIGRYVNTLMERLVLATRSIQRVTRLHHRAEEKILKNERRLRTILESAVEGFIEVDMHAVVVAVNPEMCAILQRSKQDIIGHSIFDFADDENKEILNRQFALRCLGERSSYEVALTRKDGTRVFCLCNATPLYENNDVLVGAFAMVTDISARKKAEEEVKQLNEDLEKRVELRTKELQLSMESLQRTQKQLLMVDQQQAVQAEKMFTMGSLVAGVAHEINTPVGISVTAGSFLKERAKECVSLYHEKTLRRKKLEEFLALAVETSSLIVTNLTRAANLMQSFKKVAVDQSTEGNQRINIKKYIDDLLLSLGPQLKRVTHTISVSCSPHLEITTNPGALSQILTNLIMNSIIHGFEKKERGKIFIKLVQNRDVVVLEYSDNGIGTDPESCRRIFEPFFTTKRGQGGSGLGMHVVYNLVTQTLKGTIGCTSEVGAGMHFIIRIPLIEE